MDNLKSIKKCFSKKHVGRINPALHVREDSPTICLKFKDSSEVEFELRTGKQLPRVYGSNKRTMASEFKDDLKCIDTTHDTCGFFFKDSSKFEINLNQFTTNWTKFPRNIGRIAYSGAT